jgi:hypothetical protein
VTCYNRLDDSRLYSLEIWPIGAPVRAWNRGLDREVVVKAGVRLADAFALFAWCLFVNLRICRRFHLYSTEATIDEIR